MTTKSKSGTPIRRRRKKPEAHDCQDGKGDGNPGEDIQQFAKGSHATAGAIHLDRPSSNLIIGYMTEKANVPTRSPAVMIIMNAGKIVRRSAARDSTCRR